MVILCVCAVSKWVEARPMYTNNSAEARNFIFDEIICRYGCPIIIYTNNGSEFKKEFQTLCERLGIYHHYFSSYYPKGNG